MDPLTASAFRFINQARIRARNDGEVLTLLQYGSEANRGYVALGSITQGYNLYDLPGEQTQPMLQIVETDSGDAIPGNFELMTHVALNGKVIKLNGANKVAPSSSPLVWEWPIQFTQEPYP